MHVLTIHEQTSTELWSGACGTNSIYILLLKLLPGDIYQHAGKLSLLKKFYSCLSDFEANMKSPEGLASPDKLCRVTVFAAIAVRYCPSRTKLDGVAPCLPVLNPPIGKIHQFATPHFTLA